MEILQFPSDKLLRFFIPTLLNKLHNAYMAESQAIETKITDKLNAEVQWLKDEGEKNPAIDRVIVIFIPENSQDQEVQALLAKKKEILALLYPTDACYDETLAPREASLFFALGIKINDIFKMCDPTKVEDLGPQFATVLSGQFLTDFRLHLVSAWENADRLSSKMLALHIVKCAGCKGNSKIPECNEFKETLTHWSDTLNEKYRSLLILLQSAERTDNEIVISPVVDDKLIL